MSSSFQRKLDSTKRPRSTESVLNWSNGDVNQFRVTEKLGQGVYGTVYKAVHRETGTVVALKVCSSFLRHSYDLIDLENSVGL